MKKLKMTDELHFRQLSTTSYLYLQRIVTHFIDNPEDVTEPLTTLYVPIAKEFGVSIGAVTVGVRRSIDWSKDIIMKNCPSITKETGTREIIVQLARLCEKEGWDF